MDRAADLLVGYKKKNPFSDSQARDYSDGRIISEFYPTSHFWTLFNEQHEILIGTRGSGKTFLLKMLRYSMLSHIDDPEAIRITREKKFIALYIPMRMEFVASLSLNSLLEEKRMEVFQSAFNFLLTESLLTEVLEILNEIKDNYKRLITDVRLARDLYKIWFSSTDDSISDIFSLITKLKSLYYNYDIKSDAKNEIPMVFKRAICSPLFLANDIICRALNIEEPPTWLICIDEAEFSHEIMLKCFNSVFRSDSKKIALKIATLPFHYFTYETLVPGVFAAQNNDFKIKLIDLRADDPDFISLTNGICSQRLRECEAIEREVGRLEDFVGMVGKDDQVDYFRAQFGEEAARPENIKKGIIASFPEVRKESAASYKMQRKTIYDKYAPIYFLRCMYHLTREGNYKPGWYAGGAMIRKVSQGNPRAYIQIMNDLFERARIRKLEPNQQHEVIMEYAANFCDATRGLMSFGPTIHDNLTILCENLHQRTHDGALVTTGSSFELKYGRDDEMSFAESEKWLQLAIAYSRLIVCEDVIKNGLRKDTKYALANAYAVRYWIPMRSGRPVPIKTFNSKIMPYKISMKKFKEGNVIQYSLFCEEDIDDD
ncbi:hypothetical protein SDC9_52397 [bioreactor metagenome]|uniref:Uncharacterized protein n=1 Tax=bioreactor metagenome TaxID=1076179 RepID=A0A644WRF7_9ZZZZ